VTPLPFVKAHPSGVLLLLKVQPRSSRNEIAGVLGQELKLKVTAPPVDAAANEAVIELLSELLHCPTRSVQIVRGKTSRHKQVLLVGSKVDAVCETLGAALRS